MIPSTWCRLGIVRYADILVLDGDSLDVDEVYGRGHGYGGRPKPPAGLGLRYVFAVRLVDRRIARRGDRQTPAGLGLRFGYLRGLSLIRSSPVT